MSFSPYLSLILPAYNEAARIGQTLRGVQAYLNRQPYSYELIVAADGNDGTRELVAEMGTRDRRLQVLGSAERGGKGRGIRLAVQRARGQVVGFADADDKTPIEELDKFLPWLEEGWDVVFGSRYVPGSRIEKPQPFYRRLGSPTLTRLKPTPRPPD